MEVQREQLRAGLSVQRIELARVGGPGVHHTVAHRGRCDHPRSLVVEAPALDASLLVKRVEIGIPAAKIEHAISYRGRRLDALLIVRLRVLAGLEAPFQGTACGI